MVLSRLDAKEVQQLVLPLANQRLRDDQENSLRSFCAALGNHETGLDGLTQPDFVRKDASTLAKTPQRKDHRIYLVRIRIDPRLTLGRCVALAVVRPTDSDEILGEHPQVELVQSHLLVQPTVTGTNVIVSFPKMSITFTAIV
jgi:hypothetical protein